MFKLKLDLTNPNQPLYNRLQVFKDLLHNTQNPRYTTLQLQKISIPGSKYLYQNILSQETPSQSAHSQIQEFYKKNHEAAKTEIIKAEAKVNPLLQSTIDGHEDFLNVWKQATSLKRHFKIICKEKNPKLDEKVTWLERLSPHAYVAKTGIENSHPWHQAITGTLLSPYAGGFVYNYIDDPHAIPQLIMLGLPPIGLYSGIKDQEAAIQAGDEELQQLHKDITDLF